MEQKEEPKKQRGGARENAGRKSVAEEQRVNEIFLSALKSLKSVSTDEEAKIGFAKDLLESQRGQLFIAEHLFGKPKETIDTNLTVNDFNLKDVIKFDNTKQ
jgi:hypothetical protein